jgi:hypothetical protein
MSEVLKNTQKIFFEIEEVLLRRFNASGTCSGSLVVQLIQKAGFVVKSGAGTSVDVEDLTTRSNSELLSVKFPEQDMYGQRPGA